MGVGYGEETLMIYYLDTNTIIDMLGGNSSGIKERLRSITSKNIKIPSIVRAELIVGVYKSNDPKKKREIIAKILAPYEIMPFDADASEEYGRIRAELEIAGNIIDPNDLMIAATVLSKGGTLVTNNTKEFSRVKNLLIEDWSEL